MTSGVFDQMPVRYVPVGVWPSKELIKSGDHVRIKGIREVPYNIKNLGAVTALEILIEYVGPVE